jgi:hypothetical protein
LELPLREILLSVLLPGSGHHLLGESRWVAYMGLDAMAWTLYTDTRRHADGLREAYRDLAWRVPRGRPEPRRDGDFGYYEELLKFQASGAFDRDPTRPGIQPETDPSTHNGAIWTLATELFFRPGAPPDENSPEYRRALEYYGIRGIRDDLAWDWKDNGPGRAAYARLVRDSDETMRRSVAVAGVLLANRVFSAVDLFVASRAGSPAPSRVQLRAVPGSGAQGAWLLMRITLP